MKTNTIHILLYSGLFFLMLVSGTKVAFSQDTTRNHFALSYGIGSVPNISDISTDILTSAKLFSDFETRNTTTTGAIFLEYNRFFKHNVQGGISVGYESIEKEVYQTDTQVGDLQSRFYSIMAQIRLNLFTEENLKIHSGIGIGAGYLKENYTAESGASQDKWIPVFHADLIGAEFGKDLGGFIRLGIGYKGIANGGIFFRY